MELLTAAQMRAIEQAAIDNGEVTGLELMERAGRGVVEAILEWRPDLLEGKRSAVVLCGPGNNGGDGFVVARLLKERGWAVEVFLYGDEAKLPSDAAENARRWQEIGGQIEALRSLELTIEHADLLIDAIFGTGITRPISEEMANFFIGTISAPNLLMWSVSIDLPSGLCSDSGAGLPEASAVFPTDQTVTFHAPKIGHMIEDGPDCCKALCIIDIGLRTKEHSTLCRLTVPNLALEKYFTHKYEYGHALTLSGGMGRSGAARLAARGALRIGAGVVTVGSPADAMAENAGHLTAIMLREMGGAEGLAAMLADERINAVCLGPGLGIGEETRELVAVACGRVPQPRQDSRGLDGRCADQPDPGASPGMRNVVLDADALTSFADDPATLFALLHENCVLTPHEGEFGRLFPDILEKLNAIPTTGPAYSKVDATREAAARAGCVVLFKGADTVIAHPSGRCSINSAHYERAAPWLATAGSGDVLAGMITGLLARGLSPMSAAESAAWLHVECGRTLGPGLIAEDIPEALPDILKRVLGWKPPPRDEDA